MPDSRAADRPLSPRARERERERESGLRVKGVWGYSSLGFAELQSVGGLAG